jgi:hypothetical protein
MNDNLTWSPRMCSVWAWKKKNVSISSNHKCCIEGGLINFNYKRNLTSRIILAFFPSLVAIVLQHNHLVGPGVEGRKVTSQSILTRGLGLEWHVFFILENLMKITYLTIYRIKHPLKLKKKWPPWSKLPMGSNQVGDLTKLNNAKWHDWW